MDVTLVLTHDCNLGCSYCYAGAKFAKRMPREVAERAVRLAFADELAQEAQVSFFGGEPLLAWEELVHAAQLARTLAAERGVKLVMSVTTNGTLLDATRAKRLDELGVYVGLSIDGTREAHDVGRPMMGGASSYDGVRRGLDVLVARGTPFETISVVTPNNAKWLGNSVRELAELGVPRIGLNPCYEAAFSDEELDAYERGLEDAAQTMIDAFRGGRILSISVFDNKILAALKGGLGARDRCSLGAFAVSVAPSGNLYPCERLVAEDEDTQYVMGHLDQGLPKRGEACARGPINPECQDCGERWRCGSHCACANRAETGRTDVAGGTQCWHERTTGRLGDHIAATLWSEQNPWFLAWFYGRMATASGALDVVAAPQDGGAQGVPPKTNAVHAIARKRLRVVP